MRSVSVVPQALRAIAAAWTGSMAVSDAARDKDITEFRAILAGFELDEPYLLRASTLMHARHYTDHAVLDESEALPGVAKARAARPSPALFNWDDVRIGTALKMGRFDEVLAMSAHPE